MRFIKDFSKIVIPLCKLLEKESTFIFYNACLEAFKMLKEKLVSAPIIIAPDWNLYFEMMCDASGLKLGVVLGQHKNKFFSFHLLCQQNLELCSNELHRD
ncbi:hypothetical protein MTR67_052362 [Solanum verrucosum]|uniref:Reverse transcriptase/retrotransposon-derived protein RNase H-like domain-containing protein n=1 Tax=Solanum verrucosum TaxID=315347 RepID=A0AAF0V6S9_SOLVR|nr:hypothetical protein MTR67_052362 [Solanum verrucosum]